MEGVFSLRFAGRTLLALTDSGSPNGRIVSIDPDHPQRDAWHDVVPETKARIQDLAIAGGLIFVGLMENGSTRVETFAFSAKPRGTLPCPPLGTTRISHSRPDSDVLFYSFTSFIHPPTIFRYDTRTEEQEVW